MKWIVLVVMAAALFFTGALYGIEKNQQKETEAVKVEAPQPQVASSGECAPSESEAGAPFITQIAEGIGELVKGVFNGIVLVFSELMGH
ncbi:hypothetical protein LCM20_05435 [Halobacillus litoralis]|uniref:hypothetical protein n=1 Tax=Halobacillus litoralis TaxID=45668 RepID=UPI001CD3DB76|nr:hypothetical protein [Halobacillus litoralis]MCA0970023.1 hypothetical protein [Halobacillus litoralis]